MMDWIAPCAYHSDAFTVTAHLPRQAAARIASRVDDLSARLYALPPPEEGVTSHLAWQADVNQYRPIKQSVSAVVHALETKAGEREENTAAEMAAQQRRPLFMEEKGMTATERGDAVHTFLRAVPLDAQDLAAECRNLEEKGLLSHEQAASLPLPKLRAMMDGPLWQRMRDATVLHREWPFNLRVEQEGQISLLQGVIDCCFMEQDQWILVDYKTDRAPDEELADRYRPQLLLYATALEKLTDLPVRESILYLVERNRALLL